MGAFKEPHGGELKQLYVDEAAAEQIKQESKDYKCGISPIARFVISS